VAQEVQLSQSNDPGAERPLVSLNFPSSNGAGALEESTGKTGGQLETLLREHRTSIHHD
jgi:hypothetical protein